MLSLHALDVLKKCRIPQFVTETKTVSSSIMLTDIYIRQEDVPLIMLNLHKLDNPRYSLSYLIQSHFFCFIDLSFSLPGGLSTTFVMYPNTDNKKF